MIKSYPSEELEQQRLEALKSYQILDTQPEREFDTLVELAALMCQAPIALLTFLDEARQWFKAKQGLNLFETDRSVSFCQHLLVEQDLYEISDASIDPRFKANPLVTGEPGIRFYARAPLYSPDGYLLGSLCIIDTIPRSLSEEQKKTLRTLASQVVSNLELRKQKLLPEAKNRPAGEQNQGQHYPATEDSCMLLQTFVEHSPAAIAMVDYQMRFVLLSRKWLSDYMLEGQNLIGKSFYEVFPSIPNYLRDGARDCLDNGLEKTGEFLQERAQGSAEWLRWEIKPWFHSSGDKGGLIILTENITRRKETEQQLKANDQLMKGLNFASNQFVTISNYIKALESALPIVGEALEVDQIHIYQNTNLSENQPGFVRRYYWAEDEDKESREQTLHSPTLSYAQAGLERWYHQLKEGSRVQGLSQDMPGTEAEMLKEQGVKAVMVIPVLIGYKLWGFIRFDECAKERIWASTEENLLSNFANTLGEAIARNQAQEELVNARYYLDSIINAIPASIFVKDLNHRFIMVNNACCELNNLSRDEMLGKTEDELFDSEHAETIRKKEEIIFQSGQPNVSEETIADGRKGLTTVITQKATFKNHFGEKFLIGCNLDITDRKQAEKALVKEQYLVQTFMDYTPDCIYFKDRQSRFIRINKSMLSWLGVENADAVIGKTDFDLFSAKHARKAFEMEQQIMQTGVPIWNKEQKEVWKNRKIKWVSLTKMPLFSEEGEIIGTFGISRDITESKEVQIELVNSRNYLNHIFEAIPIPIFVKNSSYRWVFLNNAWCNFTGVEREEFLRKTDYDLYPKQIADLFRTRDQSVFETGEGNIHEEVLTNIKGEEQTVITRKTLFRDQYGNNFLVGTMIDITDIKNSQIQLVNYQNYLNAIINAVADPIFVKDKDFRLILVNDSFCLNKNLSRKEILYKTDYDIFSKEDADLLRHQDETLFRTKQTQINEESLRYSGIVKTMITKKTYFTNEWNEAFLVGSATDITERKKAEVALIAKEKYFRSLIQYSSDIITVLEPNGISRYQSPSFYQILGYEEKDMMGKNLFQFIHPDDLNHVMSVFSQVLEQPGVPMIVEYRFQKLDGEWTMVESVGTNWLDHEAVGGIVINSRDITERKKAEAEIKEQSQVLHGITSSMPVIVFKTGSDGLFTQVTGAGLARLGISENDLLGKSIFDIYSQSREYIEKALEDGFGSFIATSFSNEQNWYFETYIFRDKSKPGAVVGFALDITENKISEKKLQQYAVDLEKINKELDQFAYVVSHDLKAPLRAIANLTQWIEEDMGPNLTQDIRNNMDLLRDRVSRMQALINGVLNYSRVNRTNITVEEVKVSTLLDELVSILGVPETHPVALETPMPVLITNRTRIEQVFSNLISNAIKYHDKPGGRIRVYYEETEAFHQFSVVDDGPGIDPAYHEKIFVIFQTLQASDKIESTGVGLAIVKKIVEDQGGQIWVQSELGQGSAFIFTLPKS
jgi:PAS domain S-box-containing protein